VRARGYAPTKKSTSSAALRRRAGSQPRGQGGQAISVAGPTDRMPRTLVGDIASKVAAAATPSH
jgi:hypothetical protein